MTRGHGGPRAADIELPTNVMKDKESVNRFVMLRSQGWSFSRIATELDVSKPTLIKWSREQQFAIQNLRATETEALAEKIFKPLAHRWEAMARDLARVEEELDKRKLDDIPTLRLFALVAALREKIANETGPVNFLEAEEDELDPGSFFDPQRWSA